MEMKDFTAGKQGYLVRITDEQLAEVMPFTVLTPEDAEANRLEARDRDRAYAAEITAKLAGAHPALHPVIEHHSLENSGYGLYCKGCDEGAYAEDSPAWPCSTLELILEGL